MIDKIMAPILDTGEKVINSLLPKPGASSRRALPVEAHMIFGTLTLLLFIPPILIYQARTDTSRNPRIHLFPDMDHQKKIKAQSGFEFFVDNRGMRPKVEGTIARGELRIDEHLHLGRVNGQWSHGLPSTLTINEGLLERGQNRYNIFCSPCHGVQGLGNGPVNALASVSQAAGTAWVNPTNLHAMNSEDPVPNQPLGQIYNSIANGVRNMPAYKGQIPVNDRWAIVAYVKALHRSLRPSPSEINPEYRQRVLNNPGLVIQPPEGED